MKNTVTISRKLIESDLTDLEFYLYVLVKTMKEDELNILTSINKLKVHIGYESSAETEKAIKSALKRLVDNKSITCLLIPMIESDDIEPHHCFEVVFNYDNIFEDKQSPLFTIDKLLLTNILKVKSILKMRYLRNYFKLLTLYSQLENLTNGNK